MSKAIINLPFVASLSLCAMISSNVLAATEEFTYKPASKHTIEANREAAKRLPYGDKIAFEEQARGLIATFGDSIYREWGRGSLWQSIPAALAAIAPRSP